MRSRDAAASAPARENRGVPSAWGSPPRSRWISSSDLPAFDGAKKSPRSALAVTKPVRIHASVWKPAAVIAGTKKLQAPEADPDDREHQALRRRAHQRREQLAAPELEERLLGEAAADAEEHDVAERDRQAEREQGEQQQPEAALEPLERSGIDVRRV
jgi:hypothetical protein